MITNSAQKRPEIHKQIQCWFYHYGNFPPQKKQVWGKTFQKLTRVLNMDVNSMSKQTIAIILFSLTNSVGLYYLVLCFAEGSFKAVKMVYI